MGDARNSQLARSQGRKLRNDSSVFSSSNREAGVAEATDNRIAERADPVVERVCSVRTSVA